MGNILLTPARIGSAQIRNRIVMPAMTTRLADAEGFVTEDSLAYYDARARGGVGLVTVEMAAPEKAGRHRRRELGIYDDRFLPGLQRLVTTIHAAGAKAAIQLGHAGGHTRQDICGETPIAPSAIPHPVHEITAATITPQAMTAERIRSVVDGFAAAARRAERAGFDCVEIHAAHGYLISQFHTPFENRRTDTYGGTLENRARFGLQVLAGVKAAVGTVAVIYRLTVEDFFPQGLHFDEGRQIAIWAAAAGADALHISAGHYRGVTCDATPAMRHPDAPFLAYAADIRRAVSVPVIAVGRLGDPILAANALEAGKADFIALGRTLIADPDWVVKVGRGEPVRRCLACNTCVNEMRHGARIGCVVNGIAGRELEFRHARPPQHERIAVLGAGPAGLTYASLVAGANRVTVFEKLERAGGSFRLAGRVPLFQEVEADQRSFDTYIDSLVAICRSKGVDLRFGQRVTAAALADFDRVVIATGATYRFGLAIVVRWLIERGMARWPLLARLFSLQAVRDWFYYRARRGTYQEIAGLARSGQKVVAIGDALHAGKSMPAIASAFEAALLSTPVSAPGEAAVAAREAETGRT